MLKRAGLLLLAAVVLFAAIPNAAAVEESNTVIYVSPHGNDSAEGTIDEPLKTLDGARIHVQNLKNRGVKVDEVVFREGVYRFTETVRFGAEDSGEENSPIVYRAYTGEEVQFKGSVPLDLNTVAPVTEEAILRRIHPNAEGKLLEIDLAAHGLKSSDLFDPSQKINTSSDLLNGEFNALFINDKVQTLAQWPNGRNYAHWVGTANDHSLYYDDSAPNRWGEAKNWWIRAYADFDYCAIRLSVTDIDIPNRLITLIENPNQKMTSTRSRRWIAFNLLEEIDVAGEYYVDRDRMKLYFYPPYTLKDATAELSLLATDMIHVEGAHDITFKGISFSQTCHHAIKLKDTVNVDVDSCYFTGVSGTGVMATGAYYQSGYRGAETQKDFWQRQILDNTYNCDVRNCTFFNLGGAAVNISGGNVDTITPSNNVIENNLILRTGQIYYQSAEAITLSGCGNIVRNNEVGGVPWQAVHMYGNEHKIEYNEFYDIMQEASDAAVIYCGANEVMRGYEVNYNYIHDCRVTAQLEHNWTIGIYWDGSQQGGSAEHNIFYNMTRSLNLNGASAINHRYNTSVNLDGPINIWDGTGGDDPTWSNMGTRQDAINSIANPELYLEKYPQLKAWAEGADSISMNTIYENLNVGCGESVLREKNPSRGTIKDLVELEWTDAFVDPENQDFRLKSDSELAKQMPNILNESFDISKIGIQRDFVYDETTAPFRLLHPANGQVGVSNLNTQFIWEKAMGGMMFRLVIAKDPELTDVVYDKTSEFWAVTVDGLEKNTRYYWKVYASNPSRESGNVWESDGAVYTFTTSMYDELDTNSALHTIERAQKSLAIATEGENPGDYVPGTLNQANRLIENVAAMTKLPVGSVSRKTFDTQVKALDQFFVKAKVNSGFINIADLFNQDMWVGKAKVDGESVYLENDFIIKTIYDAESNDKNIVSGTNNQSNKAGSVIYCFDMKGKWTPGDYLSIGLSMEPTTQQWTAKNIGYYLCGYSRTELQYANGTKFTWMREREGLEIFDGQKRSFTFGVIATKMGNYIVCTIDGDDYFSMPDVNMILEVPLEFTMGTYYTGDWIELTESENIPTQEEAEAIYRKAYYMLAERVLQMYNPFLTNSVALKADGTKIVYPQGVADITDTPAVLIDEVLYAPCAELAKVLGFDATVSDGSVVIGKDSDTVIFNADSRSVAVNDTFSEMKHAPVMRNGILMVPAEEAAKLLGKPKTFYDEGTCVLVIADDGHFAIADEPTIQARCSAMFDELAAMNDFVDIKFADFK